MINHNSSAHEKLDEVLYVLSTATNFMGSYTTFDLINHINHQHECISLEELGGFLNKLEKEGYVSSVARKIKVHGQIVDDIFHYTTTDGNIFINSGGYQRVIRSKQDEEQDVLIKRKTELFKYQTRKWSLIISIFSLIVSIAAIVRSCDEEKSNNSSIEKIEIKLQNLNDSIEKLSKR